MAIRFALAWIFVCSLAAATTAQATTPLRCEGGKLKSAGKYDYCRLKALAKSAQTGAAADYSKCNTQFGSKWNSIEEAAGGLCPTNGDESGIQAFISQHTDDLAAALAGGPLSNCPADLATCSNDLSTCDGSLDATTANLTNLLQQPDGVQCRPKLGNGESDDVLGQPRRL